MNAIENTECGVIGSESIKNEKPVERHTIVSGIYGLRNKITGKWYIGQSQNIQERWKDYQLLRCKNQTKLYYALVKYGYDAFDKVIVEYVSYAGWMMDYREMYWIRKYDSIKVGYNIAEGGSVGISFKGRKHTEATKKKMSQKGKGRKLSVESIEKMRKSLTGKKYGPKSEETKEKIRLGNIGKVVSEESKMKMSAAKQNVSMETRLKLSESNKGKGLGENNPCFGRRWITNGTDNKLIKGTDIIPFGWNYGKIGLPHSEESKRKISEKNKGKIRTEEFRKNITIRQTGKVRGPNKKLRAVAEVDTHKIVGGV